MIEKQNKSGDDKRLQDNAQTEETINHPPPEQVEKKPGNTQDNRKPKQPKSDEATTSIGT